MVDDRDDRKRDEDRGPEEDEEDEARRDGDGDEEDEEHAEEEDAEEEDDLVEELEAELEALRARVRELEAELATSRRAASSTRWSTWILGTFSVAASLVLVIIFLGRGFPVPRGPDEVAADEPAPAEQEEALNALVMAHADELQACLDALVPGSDLPDGTVLATAIEVEAREGGAVAEVRVTGERLPSSFSACLERAVSAWVFPAAGGYVLQAPFEVRRRGAPSPASGQGPADAAPGQGPADAAPITSE